MNPAAPEHRHTVVLVEDNDDLREAFLALASASGLDCIAFGDARDALDYLRRGARPCLILLDLAMPGMDGLAFRREQMNDAALADVPVAVVSGLDRLLERDARALGVTTFLRKPVDPKELFRLFADRCGQRMSSS